MTFRGLIHPFCSDFFPSAEFMFCFRVNHNSDDSLFLFCILGKIFLSSTNAKIGADIYALISKSDPEKNI